MYPCVRSNPATLTDPTGLDFNLACATKSDTGLPQREALRFASTCSFALPKPQGGGRDAVEHDGGGIRGGRGAAGTARSSAFVLFDELAARSAPMK